MGSGEWSPFFSRVAGAYGPAAALAPTSSFSDPRPSSPLCNVFGTTRQSSVGVNRGPGKTFSRVFAVGMTTRNHVITDHAGLSSHTDLSSFNCALIVLFNFTPASTGRVDNRHLNRTMLPFSFIILSAYIATRRSANYRSIILNNQLSGWE